VRNLIACACNLENVITKKNRTGENQMKNTLIKIAFTATALTCAGHSFSADPTLVLVGGALNENADIISRFVSLSGGSQGAIGL
jgi:hypothetical protein